MTTTKPLSAPPLRERRRPPVARRRRARLKTPHLVDIHNWVGALAAVAVIVVSVTGIMLNHIDLLGLAGPSPAPPSGGAGSYLGIEEVVARAARHAAENPDAPADLDRAQWDLNEGTVVVRFDTKPPTAVTVDAITGAVLGRASRLNLDVTQAHSGEILGPVWVVLSDFAGVALIVAMVAGVWVWIRRVRAQGHLVGARPGSAWRRAHWWFHLVGGLAAALLLFVLSVTGILLNHKRDLGLMADPPDTPDHRDDQAYSPLPVTALADAAMKAGGAGDTEVEFVDYRPKGYAKVRLAEADREIIVDAADATVIEDSRRWDVWITDLHTGLLFGSRGSLLSDLGAVLAILLTINGTYLWLVPTWRARSRSALS